MGLYDIDFEGCDFDRIGQMADIIISISASKPGVGPIFMHQAKGRGLRPPGKGPVFTLTYKRRNKRQTYKDFPFSVIAKNTPDGFHSAAKEWCMELCGDKGWDTKWETMGFTYMFKNKDHALLFVLRFKGWSEA